ncbi:family 1 glycosylhydrolase [Diplocloster agilis]|uniref:family 1 glycosylhydrolase n=1 Tax=Diplocloster agilis TaxID=2850323 RepID=UPI00130DD957
MLGLPGNSGNSRIFLNGYFQLTLIDDFEWNTGFRNKFGLIYLDRRTGGRIVKKSGYWYRKIMEQNGIVNQD